MIISEIGLHSFSTYIQLIISSSLCTRKDWQCLVRIIKSWITRNRIFLIVFLQIANFDQKNDFCKNCIGGFGLFVVFHLHFLRGMNLQFSTIAVRMHFFMFYMRICAYFGIRFMSIGVEFVLGTKGTLKRNLIIVLPTVIKSDNRRVEPACSLNKRTFER